MAQALPLLVGLQISSIQSMQPNRHAAILAASATRSGTTGTKTELWTTRISTNFDFRYLDKSGTCGLNKQIHEFRDRN
jgi:hypothetical protein